MPAYRTFEEMTGKYCLFGELGHGTVGAVFEGRPKGGGSQLAVKAGRDFARIQFVVTGGDAPSKPIVGVVLICDFSDTAAPNFLLIMRGRALWKATTHLL